MPLQVLDRPFPSPEKTPLKALQKPEPSAQVPRQRVEEAESYPSRNAGFAREFQADLAASKTQDKRVEPDDRIPQAPEIEKAVLSVILQHPDSILNLSRSINQFYFFAPAHRTIYQTICDLNENGNVGLIQLTEILREKRQLDAVGGPGFLVDLQTTTALPETLDWYVENLRDKYSRREMIRVGSNMARAAHGAANPAGELVEDFSRKLERIRKDAIIENELCDASHYLNGEAPPLPNEIIYNLLHQGSKMIVGGTSKGRKSMALIDLALSVATGSEWWGFRTRKSVVCYVNFELQDGFFWWRARQICERKAIEVSPGMLYAWNLRGHSAAIEIMLDKILSVLSQKHFALIILDPIYKALGGRDENRAGDVASMLNDVEKIAVERDSAVAFGAHYSKGNQAMKEAIDRIGGSGVFARDPDTILTMTPHENEECFTVEGTLRNFPPMYPFVVKWAWPLFVRDESDPKQLRQARTKVGKFKQEFSDELLWELLKAEGALKPKQACAMLKEAKDVSRRTVYNMKDSLEKKGVVVTNSEGLWSCIVSE